MISCGETTVRVTGQGRGGRNQEFALALAESMARRRPRWRVASIGTDGIDGPTDAAGAIVDSTTLRARAQLGLAPPATILQRTTRSRSSRRSDDLDPPGRTDTNVGDLQVLY